MTLKAINEECITLFWDNVIIVPGRGCWLWDGAVRKDDGYGSYSYKGIGDRAHRYSYRITQGEIPEGLEIDHKCITRRCVKPGHLHAVTRKKNRENLSGAHKNNSTGVRGVNYHKQTGKFRARVGHNGEVIYLGLYESVEEANEAVVNMRNELFTNNRRDREHA